MSLDHKTEYEIELRYDGNLVGNIFPITTSRSWRKRKNGVDEINFSVSLKKMVQWCEERNTTLRELVTPMKLDARIVRNGVPLLGGFLYEVPGYTQSVENVDTEINFIFDGYLNLCAGLYNRPTTTYSARPISRYLKQELQNALNRASSAGYNFGITMGTIEEWTPNDQNTYDSYKTIKDILIEQTDNTEGAGTFDVDFGYDRTFNIYHEMGNDRTDTVIYYPSRPGVLNALSVSYDSWGDFASHVIGVGAGNGVGDGGAALVRSVTSQSAIQEYGYYETMFQDSSISNATTLTNKLSGILASTTHPTLIPKITIVGNSIDIGTTFWIGDVFTFRNDEDPFLETDAPLRIIELSCEIGDANEESLTITSEVYYG